MVNKMQRFRTDQILNAAPICDDFEDVVIDIFLFRTQGWQLFGFFVQQFL